MEEEAEAAMNWDPATATPQQVVLAMNARQKTSLLTKLPEVCRTSFTSFVRFERLWNF
jgi:hypothetical protein